MIIDADCHVSATPNGVAIGPDELVRILDDSDIDRAIAWPMVTYRHEMTDDNQAIFEGARTFPDRIIPFGGVNPRLGEKIAQEDLQRCRDYGFGGIKLNGARDTFFIDDPQLSLPLIDKIAEYGMALALHCGSNDFERTHPYRVAKIAASYPDMPILMIHMGGVARPDANMHDSAIEFAAQHPNILLVDSEAHPNYILKAIDTLGPERVCFASDAPFQKMHVIVAMHHALLRDLSPEARALVMGGNIQRALSL